jgi:predicted nucleotidyltransferase
VDTVSETIDYLKEAYPHYVHFCPVRNIEMSMVPQSYIAQYYTPEERMAEIFSGPQDVLEEKVRDIAEDIMDASGISLDYLGITGSILIGLHNPEFSDMDIIVYGLETSEKVKNTLKTLENVKILSETRKEEWIKRKMNIFNISKLQAELFASRKWNYGYYKGTYFSVHPTRADKEITEEYGEITYTGMGSTTITAEIVDSSESMFLPAVYKVKVLNVKKGNPVTIEEIVSYEGVYCDVFKEGEKIEAKGRLEKVNGRYQLVVGTLEVKNQYMKFLHV